jgi:hypothetical protein
MARHWVLEAITGTDRKFELYYKRGDVALDELRASPPFLRALFEGDNPQARNFR